MVLARAMLVVLLLAWVSGCSYTPPPKQQRDICQVFAQYPDWYDYAGKSQSKWGTPVHILMAFVRHESSYRSNAKPPRRWLWFIPLGRPSSAQGYAQAQNPVWSEYQAERGSLFRSRSDMAEAAVKGGRPRCGFIGWYNHKTRWRQLGIGARVNDRSRKTLSRLMAGSRRWPARRLSTRHLEEEAEAPSSIARNVAATAGQYRSQLAQCQSRFRCDAWYQVWPLCR